MERDWQIETMWRGKALDGDSCSQPILQINVTACTVWENREVWPTTESLCTYVSIYRRELERWGWQEIKDDTRERTTVRIMWVIKQREWHWVVKRRQSVSKKESQSECYVSSSDRKNTYLYMSYRSSTKCSTDTSCDLQSVSASYPAFNHKLIHAFGLWFRSRKVIFHTQGYTLDLSIVNNCEEANKN